MPKHLEDWECLEDCEGCEECCPDWKPVYLKNGKWFATHLGCSYAQIGPFTTEGEAREFQAIEDSEEVFSVDRLFQDDSAFLPHGCVWWGGNRRVGAKHYRFARHQSGRIDPRDRWILVD